MTSHDCVRRIRRLFHTKKVGHAGTLDPLATGVLPIAIGDGTKILQFLLAENKSYRAELQLGVTTTTLDSEGKILKEAVVPEDFATYLPRVCEALTGEIKQVPPMYSALKKDGIPLYKYARQGIEIEREARTVHIYKLDILAIAGTKVTIEVACSKGTYIRSLAQDIGERLGCGAHLTALQRITTGGFTLSECRTLEELEDDKVREASLLSPDQALRDYPSAILDSTAIQQLSFGIPPQIANVCLSDEQIKEGELVKLCISDTLAAMAYFAPSRKKEKRGDFELIRVLAKAN